APRLQNTNMPMDYHGALGALRTIIKERPEAILVNEGANTLDFARSIIDMYKPRKRLDVGTWGVMGVAWAWPLRRPWRLATPCWQSKAIVPLVFRAWRSKRSAVTTCRCVWWSSITVGSTAAPASIPGAVQTWRPPSSSRTPATTR